MNITNLQFWPEAGQEGITNIIKGLALSQGIQLNNLLHSGLQEVSAITLTGNTVQYSFMAHRRWSLERCSRMKF